MQYPVLRIWELTNIKEMPNRIVRKIDRLVRR